MRSIILSSKLSLILVTAFALLSLKCTSNGNSQTINTIHRTSIAGFLSEKQFNDLFPQRDKFYTYTAFIRAVNDIGRL